MFGPKYQNCCFKRNLFQIIKIVGLTRNLVSGLIQIQRIQGGVHFFGFQPASFVQKSIWHFNIT